MVEMHCSLINDKYYEKRVQKKDLFLLCALHKTARKTLLKNLKKTFLHIYKIYRLCVLEYIKLEFFIKHYIIYLSYLNEPTFIKKSGRLPQKHENDNV